MMWRVGLWRIWAEEVETQRVDDEDDGSLVCGCQRLIAGVDLGKREAGQEETSGEQVQANCVDYECPDENYQAPHQRCWQEWRGSGWGRLFPLEKSDALLPHPGSSPSPPRPGL